MSEAVGFYREFPALASTPKAVVFNRALPDEWRSVHADEGHPAELGRLVEMWRDEATRRHDLREELLPPWRNDCLHPVDTLAANDLDSLCALLDSSNGIPRASVGLGPA